MTENLPDYWDIEPPADTPPEDYSTHERRAEVLRLVIEAGSPYAINQSRLADRYGVHRSTISRDMDRLRETVDDHLGRDAKLTTKAVFEAAVEELLAEDDWRAKKAALDAVMDWNEWLADIGEQDREPDRVEADIRTRNQTVEYQVVRGGEPDLPTDDDNRVDFEALGFADGPVGVDVEAVDDLGADK